MADDLNQKRMVEAIRDQTRAIRLLIRAVETQTQAIHYASRNMKQLFELFDTTALTPPIPFPTEEQIDAGN